MIQAAPAEALRVRLTHGSTRFWVLVATTLVWVIDITLFRRITGHHVVANTFHPLLHTLEKVSTIVFVIVTIGLAQALFRSRQSSVFRWVLIYLLFSMVQVVANVLSMVATASAVKGGGLTGLWDVAAVYMQSVTVFMFIYIFLDVCTP
ncbi:MAG: hypothetical protein ACKOYH_02645, partial [Cyanobium sp.]